MVETESQLLFGADNWSSAHIQTHVSDYRVDVLKGQCAHNLKGQHTKKNKKKKNTQDATGVQYLLLTFTVLISTYPVVC